MFIILESDPRHRIVGILSFSDDSNPSVAMHDESRLENLRISHDFCHSVVENTFDWS